MGRIPVPSKIIRGYQYVLENDFTGGLKTEFTGLNFPENACTATENCVFFHTGSVFRRSGIDYENNFQLTPVDRTQKAISSFRWLNAGGDGETQIYVLQVGATLYFFESSNATLQHPLSNQRLASTINMSIYSSGTAPDAVECQYAFGNGYLFVFHPNLTPFYCVFNNGVITSNPIDIKIRDFIGDIEVNVPDSSRPNTLNSVHQYNLQNQGWSTGSTWITTSNTGQVYEPGSTPVLWNFYNVDSGLIAQPGDIVEVDGGAGGVIQNKDGSFPAALNFLGIVTNYNSAGQAMTINITNNLGSGGWTDAVMTANGARWASENGIFTIRTSPSNDKINTWKTQIGNFPSNADVWWSFKDSTGIFNPAFTVGNVTLGSGPAPKGYYLLNAFNLDRGAAASIPGFIPVVTSQRPKTGCWFQGRVWYTGVDASVSQNDIIGAGANPVFYTWSENIYFSQIIDNTSQFGRCHQTNDPTSETLFDLLPSDGGVITIQGSGSIFKLFPITNGLLVFAANGIWFITGSTGIGFTATDYTITKLSAIQSISSTSYVDVLGYPMFWNEEGIYTVGVQNEQQGIAVNSVTLKTIKRFYDDIPVQSKKFARGSYNPITGQVQWVYRSTNEFDVTSRYQFDSMLTFSMFTQAFYPWNVPATTGSPWVHDVVYVVGPGGSTSPDPVFKYVTTAFVG